MKKILILLCVAAISLMGVEQKVDGEKVFDKACASCHIKMITQT